MTAGPGIPAGFPPARRILKGAEFQHVYGLRRRVSDSFFSVNFAPNTLGHPRLGLSVGAKMVGNAVSRNRVKRAVRESFRLNAVSLPGIDCVVGARAGARTAHNARLHESLLALWNRVARQCANSPAE
jgi:ribonuclease P protein component